MAENGDFKERHEPKFQDLTGVFTPEARSPIRSLRGLRDFLVNRQMEKAFWTPERKVLAQRIAEAVNQELEPFGAPKVEFRQDQVKLLKKEAMDFMEERHILTSGYIQLCPEFIESDEKFASLYIHALLHNLSLRLFHKRGKNILLRRAGHRMAIRPEEKEGWAQELAFKDLDEAVVKKTTSLILTERLGFKTADVEIWKHEGASYEVEILNTLCQTIARYHPERRNPEDVFRLFQEATFGKGRALELARVIEQTYGRGSFRHLAILLTQVPKTETTLLGRKAWAIDPNSSHHKKLFEFLRGSTISPILKAERIKRSVFEAAKAIGQERRRCYNWMKSIVERLNIEPLSKNDLVINVGCGNGRDNLPINSVLTGQPFGWPGNVRVIGVDSDRRVIEQAEREF